MENLKLSQYLAGLPIDQDRILELLEHMNIGEKADKYTHRLSTGEKQRVSIAMALVNEPDLILADEPTSALDDKNAKKVIHLLLEECKRLGSTLVVVTHDQRLKGEFNKEIDL
jgi:putative ABC transport system ATP-binding protein